MRDHMLKVQEYKVSLADETFIEVEHQAKVAYMVDERVLVLYDADAYWRNFGSFQFGQFPNLVAIDSALHTPHSALVRTVPTYPE